MIKKIAKIVFVFIFIFALYIIGGLVHGTINDWNPEEKISITPTLPSKLPKVISDSIVSILTWNLGYAGLSADCEIFYPKQGKMLSKGRMIRPDRPITERNIAAGIQFVKEHPADILLFQEMDIKSKRSHFIPMNQSYQNALIDYGNSFADNFKVVRVPTPLLEPWRVYGAAHSGLSTFFNTTPSNITRLQLPARHPWPDRIFHLDRCLSVHRFPTAWNKDLVVINLHNSAFDKGGVMKKVEMDYLKSIVIPEYQQGNYVVVGGDWNQSPPYFPSGKFDQGQVRSEPGQNISAELFPEDWKWIFDPLVPTIRSSSEKYVPKKTRQGLIDFFLISPNCQALSVKGFDEQFKYSDHQPVRIEIILN